MSKKEAMRLMATTEGLKSLEDIENALGKADHVRRYRPLSGFLDIMRPSGSRETKSVRVLAFTRLSGTAYVQFEVFSNGEVRRTIGPRPKPLDASAATGGSVTKRAGETELGILDSASGVERSKDPESPTQRRRRNMPDSAKQIAAWAPRAIFLLAVPEYLAILRFISKLVPYFDMDQSRRVAFAVSYMLLGVAYMDTGLWTSAIFK